MFWLAEDGTIIVDATGKPIDCSVCPCEEREFPRECPEDCSGCEETYDATISGVTGTCGICSEANTTIQITRDEDTCVWYGIKTISGDPSGTIEIYLDCPGPGSNDWNTLVVIDAIGTGCGGEIDQYSGGMTNVNDCPAGTHVLDQVPPYGDCAGSGDDSRRITVVIS